MSPFTGAYYVEKASRYFPAKASKNKLYAKVANTTNDTNTNTIEDGDFHSIVYKEADVEDPHHHDSGKLTLLCVYFSVAFGTTFT